MKPNWKTIKLVALNWVIFTMLVSAYALFTLNERNQELRQEKAELEQENSILKGNLIEIEKQYPNQSIKLELKK